MSARPAAPTAAPAEAHHTQVKETLISIIIAFVLAFVFRAFVIEAFIIPTGSMAPTLMGAHERITSPATGYVWPVGPWFGNRGPDGTDYPFGVQGDTVSPIRVNDPMTGTQTPAVHLTLKGVRRQSGDRILVFKYLRHVYDPARFDVVVFKAPQVVNAAQNYIKRLVGLPNQEVALVDGDVFAREPSPGERVSAGKTWGQPGWSVQRKSRRVQEAVWQHVFSSEYQPIDPTPRFRSPWLGGGDSAWKIDGQRSYKHEGSGPAVLDWDLARWPIQDFYSYNETSHPESPKNAIGGRQQLVFAVSDLRMGAAVDADGALNASAVIRARGQEFRADIAGRDVTLRAGTLGPRQPDGFEAAPAQWTTLGTGTMARPLGGGAVVNLEFWHVDQALWLLADGEVVAHGEYDWTIRDRLARALSIDLDQLVAGDAGQPGRNRLSESNNYPQASRVRWEFSGGGGPFTLHRVALDRDIHYQAPRATQKGELPRAAHPLNPMILGPDQFFVCGDNSPASLDARMWGDHDPWVSATIDEKEGIVPRKLMIGRAFFVYFPSLIRGEWSPVPMPDFGRMRLIW